MIVLLQGLIKFVRNHRLCRDRDTVEEPNIVALGTVDLPFDDSSEPLHSGELLALWDVELVPCQEIPHILLGLDASAIYLFHEFYRKLFK